VTATVGVHIDGSATSANNVRVTNLTVRETNSHAICINDSGDSRIENNIIEDVDASGSDIGNNVDYLFVVNNFIDRATTYGANLSGTNILDTIFVGNSIHDSGQYAIRIGAGSNQTIVAASNLFFDNIVGNILEIDGSQNVFIEQERLDKPSDDIRVSVESLRNSHSSYGTTYYWSPYDGSDANNGLIPSKAVSSFRKALSLTTSGSGDTIIALATNPAGTTVTTETMVITKNYVFLRGPGRGFIFCPKTDSGLLPHGTVTGTFEEGETITQAVTGATATMVHDFASDNESHVEDVVGTFDAINTVTGGTSGATTIPTSDVTQALNTCQVNSSGVEISGVKFESERVMGHAIHVDGTGGADQGNFFLVENCFVEGNEEEMIHIEGSRESIIRNNFIDGLALEAIDIAGTCDDTVIADNVMDNLGLDGILLAGTGNSNTIIENNQIHNTVGYAINISAGTDGTKIRKDNFFSVNTAGTINDLGTNTSFEAEEDNREKYNGEISINGVTGVAGTEFPIGTDGTPVSNLTDALAIASALNIDIIRVTQATLTPGSGEVLDGITFKGAISANMLLINAPSTANCKFENMFVAGTQNGAQCVYDTCAIGTIGGLTLTDFDGTMNTCFILGDISVSSGAVSASLQRCTTATVLQAPKITGNGIINFGVFRHEGDLEIANIINSTLAIIEIFTGVITVGSTCTSGTVYIRGQGEFVDNSGVGCTLDTDELLIVSSIAADIDLDAIADAVWDEASADHNTADTMGRLQNTAASGGVDPDILAAAVWDRLRSAHTTDGTMGASWTEFNLNHLVPFSGTINDASATVTSFITSLTETRDDFFNDVVILFTSGNLKGQPRRISDYDGTLKMIVVGEDFSEPPANGDAFIIVSSSYLNVLSTGGGGSGAAIEINVSHSDDNFSETQGDASQITGINVETGAENTGGISVKQNTSTNNPDSSIETGADGSTGIDIEIGND
jgi:hypothetical protein